jgi:hypothetical protein
MSIRRAAGILGVVVLACSILVSVGVSAGERRQPEPARSGVRAPEIEAAYRAAQADLNASEETRVRAAVDAYFTLKYGSLVRGDALELGSVVDTTALAGKSLRDYELGRLQYSQESWQLCGLAFKAYDYRPVYDRIEVQGQRARVIVHPWVDLTYADVADQPDAYGGEQHEFTLERSAGGWKITSEVYDDEFTLSYPRGTNFAALEARLPEMWAALEARWAELAAKHRDDPRSRYRYDKDGPVSILGYRSYDRDLASWYGKTYTDNTGGKSTTYYNKNFVYFYGSDCQNFVSQCIWYGFGGQNTSTAINNHYLPMVYNISGATCWWADKNGACGPPYHWAAVVAFRDMVTGNYNSDKVGVQAYEGGVSDIWPGDYIGNAGWGHVYIVVGVSDLDGDGLTDYNEIYVSAHTSNRKNYRLNLLEPVPDVHFMYIDTFKNP